MRRFARILTALFFCAFLTASAAEVRADPIIISNVSVIEYPSGLHGFGPSVTSDLFPNQERVFMAAQSGAAAGGRYVLLFQVAVSHRLNEQDFLRISFTQTGGEPVTLPLVNSMVNHSFCAACSTQQTTILFADLFLGEHYLNNGMFVGTMTVELLNANPDFIIPGTGQAVDSYTFNIRAARPVPEPATVLLLSTGLAGAAAYARRRRRGV